jgi:hypothetical protein
VEIQLALDHSQLLPLRKAQWDDIVMQQRITKEKWLAEMVEIQWLIMEKQTTDYEKVIKVWEGRNKDLQSLEKQQV